MKLVDIGNSRAHLFLDGEALNLSYIELFDKFKNDKLYYINVNPKLTQKLQSQKKWINIEPFVSIDGEYKGMGVDRKVLLHSYGDGIYIDAGSAITIDKKIDNIFIGGTILLGLYSVKKAYLDISSILRVDDIEHIDITKLPKSNTKESILYGIIAPIISLVKSINNEDLPIYCTGGDGKILAQYLNAKYDKGMIFKGMQKVIKEIKC